MRRKIAIVGLGHRACYYDGQNLPFSQLDVELCGVCDRDPSKLAPGRAKYSNIFRRDVPGYDNHLELFEREKPDGVYIITANGQHMEVAVDAMDRGIHVLCEKPLEVSLERCDKILESARRSKVLLAAAMQMHYRRRYHRIRNLIEKGSIGEPIMTWCVEFRRPFAQTKHWVWEPEQSGGTLVEKNCHHYDIFDLWLGGSLPDKVYATGGIAKHQKPYGYPSRIVDHAYVVNDYENGAKAMVEISFFMESYHSRTMGVQGTEGRIWIDTKDGEIIHLIEKDGTSRDFEEPGEIRGGLYRDFLDCIISGKQPLVDGVRARRSLLIPLAGELSMKEGRRIDIKELDLVLTSA